MTPIPRSSTIGLLRNPPRTRSVNPADAAFSTTPDENTIWLGAGVGGTQASDTPDEPTPVPEPEPVPTPEPAPEQ